MTDTQETQEQNETGSPAVGYAIAGVLVVLAVGAATRFLETQVPQWAAVRHSPRLPSRSNSPFTQSLWASSETPF